MSDFKRSVKLLKYSPMCKTMIVLLPILMVCVAFISVSQMMKISEGGDMSMLSPNCMSCYTLLIGLNSDMTSQCKLYKVSPLRRYQSTKFSSGVCGLFGLAIFAADALPRLIMGAFMDISISEWGGYSIMTALFIAMVLTTFALAIVNPFGLVAFIGCILLMLGIHMGLIDADFHMHMFDSLAANGVSVMVLGTAIVLVATALLYAAKCVSYKKVSSAAVAASALNGSAGEMLGEMLIK